MVHHEETPEFKAAVRKDLRERQHRYKAGKSVRNQVSDKVFVGLAGPFGVGKSTITEEVLRIKPEIEPILTTTTRGRKGEDPSGFKTADEGVTFESMQQAVHDRELINYSVIKGADIYGTYPEDFPAQHTIGPFLPTSIEHIRKAGFERTHFVYVVSAGELWRGFVEKTRRGLPADRFQSRTNEAISSLSFALNHMGQLSFVENTEGKKGAHSAAKKIAKLTLTGHANMLPPDVAEIYLHEMLEEAKKLA